jgi:hypothetical protein
MKMAATMMPAAEMVTTTAVMTAAPAATVTASMPAAASRDGKVRHRQRRCEDNGGNSQCDF